MRNSGQEVYKLYMDSKMCTKGNRACSARNENFRTDIGVLIDG